MRNRIGHASIDENGRITGGKNGDQSTREICIQKWYSKPWNVYLECTDKIVADKAADNMEQICKNKNFGYDQDQRLTGYHSIMKNGGKISGAKGEFDCSSLVSSCYKLAGLQGVSEENTTTTLRRALLATGKFIEYTDKSHTASASLAKRGGIFLLEGHHVAMFL